MSRVPVQNAVYWNQASARTVGPFEAEQVRASSMSLSVAPTVLNALSPPTSSIAVAHSSLSMPGPC